MSWFSRFKDDAKRNLPGLAGDVVQVGAEGLMEAHGFGPVEAKEAALLVRAAVQSGISAVRSPGEETAILRVARVPDAAVTPCWFVYAMPVRQHRVESSVLAVAPRIWLSAQQAALYADNIAHEDMGLAKRPALIAQDEAVVEGADDRISRQAWEQWRQDRRTNPRPVGASVVFGSYVLGEMPDGGVIAWAPVLSRHGVRAGVLSENHLISLDEPPQVFKNQGDARRELHDRGLAPPLDFLYLPPSLAAELQVGETGELQRVSPRPRIWAGDPVAARVEKRFAPDPEPVFLRPDWYASRGDDGKVWAWKSVSEGQVSFARIRDRDGQWKTATWGSVTQCLRDLGTLGEFTQEHPTLVVTPSLAVPPPRKVVQGPNI